MIDVGTTVVQLADALVAQKGRVASAPTDVMLGGFPAKKIELTVPADLDTTACDGGVIRFWPDAGGNESGGLCCSTPIVESIRIDHPADSSSTSPDQQVTGRWCC
jgi:hypothetical protein